MSDSFSLTEQVRIKIFSIRFFSAWMWITKTSENKSTGMDKDKIRVVKISRQALFEFIYENFIEHQEDLLDVDPVKVTNMFEFDSEKGEFVFCAMKNEDADGKLLTPPKNFNLATIMKKIPDTADSVFSPSEKCYKDYSKDLFFSLSEDPAEKDV